MVSDEKLVWIGGIKGTALGEVWAAMSAQGLAAVEFPAKRETIRLRS